MRLSLILISPPNIQREEGPRPPIGTGKVFSLSGVIFDLYCQIWVQ